MREQQGTNFFTGESIDRLKFKWFLQTHSFSLHKILIDGLEWCGLLLNYCDVFISCLDSHSDGTHSLQRIHWWASDVMLHFSKSGPMKKQTHLHLGWPEGEYIYILGWNTPLKFINNLYLLCGTTFMILLWCFVSFWKLEHLINH